jgi:RNA polymerase sigma-32 factor
MLMNLDGQNSLAKYLTEIYRVPLLTPEEEVAFARAKEGGDLNAAKMLISSHLRLVVKIAFRYKNYGLPMMDMISEGNMGLMKAVKNYSLARGCKLATYAMWWIMASIQDFILRSWSLVKIGTTAAQKKLFFNLAKIKNKIMGSNQKSLNIDNVKYIANTLNVSENDVLDMNGRLFRKDIYLNDKKSTANDSNAEMIEFLPSRYSTPEIILSNRSEEEKRKDLLRRGLDTLDEREREIVLARRLAENPSTLRELSAKYGVSGERIRQIEENSIRKIQDYARSRTHAIG